NGDGWVDIYVSAVSYLTMHGHNVLYINNGDGTFTDRTKEYGLDHVGASTQALFFDYDGDGDLDMYLLNHSTHTERAISRRATGSERTPRAGDRLFRNDGGHLVDEAISRPRSEEHTSELQSRGHLVCRLLLEKKKTT